MGATNIGVKYLRTQTESLMLVIKRIWSVLLVAKLAIACKSLLQQQQQQQQQVLLLHLPHPHPGLRPRPQDYKVVNIKPGQLDAYLPGILQGPLPDPQPIPQPIPEQSPPASIPAIPNAPATNPDAERAYRYLAGLN